MAAVNKARIWSYRFIRKHPPQEWAAASQPQLPGSPKGEKVA